MTSNSLHKYEHVWNISSAELRSALHSEAFIALTENLLSNSERAMISDESLASRAEPIRHAIETNDVNKLKKELRKTGALRGCLANIYIEDNLTPLHYTAKKGYHECLTLLLQHQDTVAVNAVEYRNFHTPLTLAAKEGHFESVAALLKCGADIRYNNRSSQRSVLHYACLSGGARVVEECLQLRAFSTEDSTNVLSNSNVQRQNEMRLFIAQDLVHRRDLNGLTALDLACIEADLETVRLLVEIAKEMHREDVYQYLRSHLTTDQVHQFDVELAANVQQIPHETAATDSRQQPMTGSIAATEAKRPRNVAVWHRSTAASDIRQHLASRGSSSSLNELTSSHDSNQSAEDPHLARFQLSQAAQQQTVVQKLAKQQIDATNRPDRTVLRYPSATRSRNDRSAPNAPAGRRKRASLTSIVRRITSRSSRTAAGCGYVDFEED